MGNEVSTGSTPNDAVSVILPDGTVREFPNPPSAAELMMDHPHQMVVEYRPDTAGANPTPLPADEKLKVKKIYMMLPMRRGKLTAEELRRVLSCAGAVVRCRRLLSFTGIIPVIVKAVSRSGGGRVVKKEAAPETESLPERLEMELPEYLSRQVSGRGWRPSLDTIKEKTIEKNMSRRLF